MWTAHELVNAAAVELARREALLVREQAVYGLDALCEVELHPVLAEGLGQECGVVVKREMPYPLEWNSKRTRRVKKPGSLPVFRDRQRCDLVILPHGAADLADPLRSERARSSHLSAEAVAVKPVDAAVVCAGFDRGGGSSLTGFRYGGCNGFGRRRGRFSRGAAGCQEGGTGEHQAGRKAHENEPIGSNKRSNAPIIIVLHKT